ncbi:hypothetical protein MVEN_02312900 [Mycena venus]|uniref:Uncharacterized protein n=1 Tax=Mycena venus TaxID=2733690 RepID=A0A8H6X496_9AGAR|nr:hypothetical protein MVEN_02312900 [Mycena venus]
MKRSQSHKNAIASKPRYSRELTNRGGAIQAKRRTQRAIQRGFLPPEAISPEINAAVTPAAAAAAVPPPEEDAEDEGGDEGENEGRPTRSKKGVSDKRLFRPSAVHAV